jgi:2-(1,2-epoxy-1,2-dihydrophenyl)acetyl-CoA isomerase
MSDSILLSINEGVATITLNRPQSLNSFNTEMHLQLRDAIATVAADSSVRCVLLTGAGRGFCAGQDLGDRNFDDGQRAPDLGATLNTYYNPLIKSIRDLPLPVICAVNGVAAGAGANIALACDLVIAAESASFIQAFCRLGLIPDAGGTWVLPRLVGLAKAKGLALLGDKLSATQAEKMGLIWEVKADDELMPHCQQLAQHLATQPTYGLGLIKQSLNASLNNDLDSQLALESEIQRKAGQSQDYQIGVQAFMNKQKPVYTGR